MLDEALASLVETVGGARVALLVGMDGVIVSSAGESSGPGWDLVAACWTDLERRARLANAETGLGEPVELIMTSDQGVVLLRLVTREYGLLVVLAPGGSLGRARFELRKAASRVRPELET